MEMEMEMELKFTTLVIEVKYGDTFKRFDAPVNESGELDLDFAGLKEKVSSLFSLPSKGEHVLIHFPEVDDDEGFILLGDEYLSNAASLHLGRLKEAHYQRIVNQFKQRLKRCRTESTTGDSKAKEDGEIFKVECMVRDAKDGFEDETSLLPQVIEVKYGDILKRFDALAHESGELDLDFAELRTKIRGLFSLPSEAELALTYFDKDGDVFTIAHDKDLWDAALLKNMKLDISDMRHEIKGIRKRLSGAELSDSEPEAKKDGEVFNLKCEVRATQKCKSKEKYQSSSLPQAKKVKWYEPVPSSLDRYKELEKHFIEEGRDSLKGFEVLEFLFSKGRCTELEKRYLEAYKEYKNVSGELSAAASDLIHFAEELEAKNQFCHSLNEFEHSMLSNDGKMSKLYRKMLQTTMEMCMEVPETPEEFIEKCKLIESNIKGFRENALKASRV